VETDRTSTRPPFSARAVEAPGARRRREKCGRSRMRAVASSASAWTRAGSRLVSRRASSRRTPAGSMSGGRARRCRRARAPNRRRCRREDAPPAPGVSWRRGRERARRRGSAA
jgi:hypothetical protein